MKAIQKEETVHLYLLLWQEKFTLLNKDILLSHTAHKRLPSVISRLVLTAYYRIKEDSLQKSAHVLVWHEAFKEYKKYRKINEHVSPIEKSTKRDDYYYFSLDSYLTLF